jgi:ParB-like chromosome segregation protein Spo0J
MSETPTHIKDLIEDPTNRRKHNPRNLGMVADSLQQVGAARSIVIDERNEILAGNGVVEAAGQVGITNVKVVDADGHTLVAVRRSGLTDEQKRQLAMYDNRTTELSEWNVDQLKLDQEAGLDLSPFFTEDELKDVLGTGEDEAAQEIEEMQVGQPSDVVWVLLAIPVAEWPKHLPVVQGLQHKAQFSASVVRNKSGKVKSEGQPA